jgi:hypothetical protein
MGMQKIWLLFADEDDDIQQSKSIVYRRDLTAQMEKGIIGDMQSFGETERLFLGLLRGSRGHNDIDSSFLKASDQFEEDSGSPPLIKSGYEL